MKLTDFTCKNLKPKNKPFKRSDGRGLFILIQPNGSKLWRYKYRIDGKEKLYAIGAYPELGQFYRKLIKNGKHPKTALTAVMRKLVILANTLIAEDRYWQPVFP